MQNSLEILILNSAGNTGASSFLDHIGMFAKYSRHNCHYHNFIYDFDTEIDFEFFDVIVITHNFWPEALTPERREKLSDTSALKVLFLQDEYQCVRSINKLMAEMGIEVMFSCVNESDLNIFYPKQIISSLLHVEPVLTGYVPDYLTAPEIRARGERKFDVGYRSRVSPYYLGKLGHQKRLIAEKFSELCPEQGLRHNISVAEEDRLYGKQWVNFLRSCRTQLGTPSGSSIVDFNDTLMNAEVEFRKRYPHCTFEQVHNAILAPYEGNVVIDTVSPRVFEAAATGSTMVMLEGRYGEILEPNVHYIPIKEDYSNLPEVASMIRDTNLCDQIADKAYDDLIQSEKFSCQNFILRFDEVIEKYTPKFKNRPQLNKKEFENSLQEKHNQCLYFSRDGYGYDHSKEGKRLSRYQRNSNMLYCIPALGNLLSRVGGDPFVKLGKARAALNIARKNKPLNRLLTKWMTNSELRNSISIEMLLKDILLLCMVKSGQAGCAYPGNWFRTSVKSSDNEKFVLEALPVQPDHEYVKSDNISVLGLEGGAKILLDMTKPFPTKKFANATILVWPINGQFRTIRSEADEYFHLKGLTIMAETDNYVVINALKWSLKTPSLKEKTLLEKVFGVPF